MRPPGLEPGPGPWQGPIIPLDNGRVFIDTEALPRFELGLLDSESSVIDHYTIAPRCINRPERVEQAPPLCSRAALHWFRSKNRFFAVPWGAWFTQANIKCPFIAPITPN